MKWERDRRRRSEKEARSGRRFGEWAPESGARTEELYEGSGFAENAQESQSSAVKHEDGGAISLRRNASFSKRAKYLLLC